MKIPSRTDCYRIIYEMEMLDHIIIHSLQVSRVATFLVDSITTTGITINRDIVEAAALLHDITKTRSLSTRENHASTGAQFLDSLGYPRVADIVRQHVRLDRKPSSPLATEGEIVHYADKRVRHDQVVTLEERHRDILERYGVDPEHRQRINETFSETKNLETLIFQTLPFAPDEIGALMGRADFTTERLIFKHYNSVHHSSRTKQATART